MFSDVPKVTGLIVRRYTSVSAEPGFLPTVQCCCYRTEGAGSQRPGCSTDIKLTLRKQCLHRTVWRLCRPFSPLGILKSTSRLQRTKGSISRFHGYGLFVVYCIDKRMLLSALLIKLRGVLCVKPQGNDPLVLIVLFLMLLICLPLLHFKSGKCLHFLLYFSFQ